MAEPSNRNATSRFFEDFCPGDIYCHARGKTVGELENVLITHIVMNTADTHFNEAGEAAEMFGQRIVFGGVTMSVVIGLSAQDTAENALAELGLDKLRFRKPVFHGDSLRAFTEVLSANPSERADAGIVRFHHWGVNQKDEIVFEGERRVLVRKRTPA